MLQNKRTLLTLIPVALLTGCASSKLGPEAKYVSLTQGESAPLHVSATFRPDLCSDYLGYLVFSVHNPGSDWKELNNLSLTFPYGASSQFSPVGGKNLLAWADAQSLKEQRETHNAAMARLAVQTVSAVAIVSSDDQDVQSAAAAMYLAERTNNKATEISHSAQSASAPKGQKSNHILSQQLVIPPKMDRSFWVLLSVNEQAPLMSWVSARYLDENQVEQQLVVSPSKQHLCHWQKHRVDYLESWARKSGMKESEFPKSKAGNSQQRYQHAVELEAEYQKSVHIAEF
ncbi:hypothetical protein [Bacterioplanoides sp.]|uniref:hypothetical protein n=1 Tax=Bacterioplanoides sp. TaxID=2066072 RepID=UPI003B0092A1